MSSWQDSDQSSDDISPDRKKRSSRACDQCRKTKSKCERPESGSCRTCALAATGVLPILLQEDPPLTFAPPQACTFLGPSYKRGPPKGYIHAIEQRWHQVESLLGAMVASPDPRTQAIISELKRDDLARGILNRVDAGPFGPTGRLIRREGATKEDFFASVLRSGGTSPVRDTARSRRQSRVSREIVSSSQDDSLSTVPTVEWQDQISNRLASCSPSPSTSYSIGTSSPKTYDISGSPLTQRRRLDLHLAGSSESKPNWSEMYTMDTVSDTEEFDTCTDTAGGIGHLSLDENQEIRFHGKASGLHLLGRSDRTDDRHEGGIWHLPMARVWPPAEHRAAYLLQENDLHVQLPPVEMQDHLIDLYFTYVHPVLPVVHKTHFIAEYKASKPRFTPTISLDTSPFPPKPEPSQNISKLLLLSMFAIAARYADGEIPPPPKGKMWEAGCDFLDDAREILTKVFHRSRASTCQSLLLLGHREFGIGSMQQGWIYLGMAIRMALDLGLNRNADKWQAHGADLFSSEEKQIRKQIWWCCCIADKYGSVYMGRPISLRDGDFDTPLPEVYRHEEEEPWEPLPSDPAKIYYPPVPGRIISCFRAAASLSVIMGSIMTTVYSVYPTERSSRHAMLTALETRLDQWYIGLPEGLRYDTTSKRIIPPPHILLLHIRYWGSVLLLHRAFIPNWKGTESVPQMSRRGSDTTSLKAFDLCQGAASHISTIVSACLDNFGLKRSSPLLSCFLLSAGIMHVVTLTLRPSNIQASLGLHQCLVALKEMEMIWPSASRAHELLHGVKIQFDNAWTHLGSGPDRHKRHADDAFGREKNSDLLQREAFGILPDKDSLSLSSGGSGVQDITTRIMAHMLGLDIPGIEPSTSYLPGYEWWPRQSPNQDPRQMQPSSLPSMDPSSPSSGGQSTFESRPEWYHTSSDPLSAYAFDVTPQFEI